MTEELTPPTPPTDLVPASAPEAAPVATIVTPAPPSVVIPPGARVPTDHQPKQKSKKRKKKSKSSTAAASSTVGPQPNFDVEYKGHVYTINGENIDSELVYLLSQEDLGGMAKATELLIGPIQRRQYFMRARAEGLDPDAMMEDMGAFMGEIISAVSEKLTGSPGN